MNVLHNLLRFRANYFISSINDQQFEGSRGLLDDVTGSCLVLPATCVRNIYLVLNEFVNLFCLFVPLLGQYGDGQILKANQPPQEMLNLTQCLTFYTAFTCQVILLYKFVAPVPNVECSKVYCYIEYLLYVPQQCCE